MTVINIINSPKTSEHEDREGSTVFLGKNTILGAFKKKGGEYKMGVFQEEETT
jgi:hypothetical protein